MSLVGSEVDVYDEEVQHHTSRRMTSPSSATDDASSVQDLHPPISPKSGAELLFFSHELNTQQISALALAQEIRHTLRSNHSGSRGSGWTGTVATDDYQTANENDVETLSDEEGELRMEHFDELEEDEMMRNGGDDEDVDEAQYHRLSQQQPQQQQPPSNLFSFSFASTTTNDFQDTPFGKDALVHSRDYHEAVPTTIYHDSKMTSSPSSSENMPMENAAEKAYDTAKNVWGWGKGLAVIGGMFGLAETVATKAVNMAGMELTDVDSSISQQLATLDTKYLNPAVSAIVSVIMGMSSKTQEIFKPFLEAMLKPVGMIKNSAESNNPELTSKPGITA